MRNIWVGGQLDRWLDGWVCGGGCTMLSWVEVSGRVGIGVWVCCVVRVCNVWVGVIDKWRMGGRFWLAVTFLDHTVEVTSTLCISITHS